MAGLPAEFEASLNVRTLSEFRFVCLAKSKKLHGVPVDKKNVLEIDGKATRFLFKYASKRIDMFSCNPAADDQQHEVFSADDSVDSAAHDGLPIIIPDWPSGPPEPQNRSPDRGPVTVPRIAEGSPVAGV